MGLNRSAFFKGFLFSFAYFLFFFAVQWISVKNGVYTRAITAQSLIAWDVGYYKSIAEGGYNFGSHNTGFFLLFPLVWRLLQVNIWAIVFFNGLAFSAGMGLLNSLFSPKNPVVLYLVLTLPSIYFNFIPYTEALYFLLGAAILYAYQRRQKGLLILSLFLLSLTRATALLVVPALCLCELLAFFNHRSVKTFFSGLLRAVLPVLAGTAAFIGYQFSKTGVWFAYYKTQAAHWDHKFSWPHSPFSNIEGAPQRYHWLSALAVFVGFMGLAYALNSCYRFYRSRQFNAPVLVSAVYLALVTGSILFMNPTYPDGHTNVMGAHRYVFAAPFLFAFLQGVHQEGLKLRGALAVVVVAHVTWQLFDAYYDRATFISRGLLPWMEVLLFLVPLVLKRQYHLYVFIMLVNFSMQLAFFQNFIQPLYVD